MCLNPMVSMYYRFSFLALPNSLLPLHSEQACWAGCMAAIQRIWILPWTVIVKVSWNMYVLCDNFHVLRRNVDSRDDPLHVTVATKFRIEQ